MLKPLSYLYVQLSAAQSLKILLLLTIAPSDDPLQPGEQ